MANLLATELFDVECHQVEHRASMEWMGDDINISFQPVAPSVIRAQLEQVEEASSNIPPPSSSEKPTFGPRPDTHHRF